MATSDNDEGTPQARHAALTPGDGRARTRTLGVLVAVMVVAGVVALVMTLFGNGSNSSQAANQPSGSQVGQTRSADAPSTSAPSTVASSTVASSTSVAPTTSAPTPAAASTTAPAKTTVATSKAAKAGATKIVKYKVKPGDNLTLIAKWFNQRGYGLVYDWNKSVIGKNPNLIHPGQTIIVSLKGDKMKVSAATK